ncbi:DNA mismatch repair protein MutT [Paenibacillus sp. CCS19]|uniref:NUDIX hydrolase n=1 Tax=Paenibacillus sp. CCS19 TaxID=3158387 RepID=UPI002560300A|nr:NUDIX hydrolase [Paenibacillus cellulosilyticus]GMK37011.1 DNA mismatch repair protein MutT [Paenibacillus cellulosilyticus]
MTELNHPFHRHTGVYGICTQDNRLLVIRKILGPYTGRYDLPGGRLEKEESLQEGIIREFREETGCTVREMNSIGVCDFALKWYYQGELEIVHHIAMLYEVSVDANEIRDEVEAFIDQDSNGAIWLPLDEVTEHNASPLVLQAIEWIRSGALHVNRQTFDFT